MFNIKDYLEKIYCPCCSKDSFKILNNSNYKNIDSFNVENYMAENWFPAGLEMYMQEFEELTTNWCISAKRITIAL